MKNNLTLRNKQREAAEIVGKIADLEEKLGGIDVAYLSRERRKLQNQLEELTREVRHYGGTHTRGEALWGNSHERWGIMGEHTRGGALWWNSHER